MVVVSYSQDARLIFTSWRPLSGLSVLYIFALQTNLHEEEKAELGSSEVPHCTTRYMHVRELA